MQLTKTSQRLLKELDLSKDTSKWPHFILFFGLMLFSILTYPFSNGYIVHLFHGDDDDDVIKAQISLTKWQPKRLMTWSRWVQNDDGGRDEMEKVDGIVNRGER